MKVGEGLGVSMFHRQRGRLCEDAVDDGRSRPRRVDVRRAGLDDAPEPLSAELVSMERRSR